jgi:hypothetical protein
MPFQSQVFVQPAPAVEGDFASANPRFTTLAGPGGFVAGAAGATVGRFAWTIPAPVDPNSAPQLVNSFGAGPVAGFIHREQQALITAFLAESGMIIPTGFPLTLSSGGDFWAKNTGAAAALIGQKAYANVATGAVTFAATGAPTAGASSTGTIAAATFSVTGSIANNVLTVTAVGSGTVVNGATISGTGITTGTKIVSQISGTPGGVGSYYVTPAEQTVASTTVSGTYGLFTAVSGLTGLYTLGGVLSGTSVVAGTTITQFGTGTGGLGTYFVDPTGTTASTAITETTNVETKWIAMSSGLTNELIKISDHVLG